MVLELGIETGTWNRDRNYCDVRESVPTPTAGTAQINGYDGHKQLEQTLFSKGATILSYGTDVAKIGWNGFSTRIAKIIQR